MEQFKRVKVVMLATNEKSIFFQDSSNNNVYLCADDVISKNPTCINQHLYITSDDEIKEGDWKYNEKLNCITQHCRESKEIHDKLKIAATWCKKIISTTDKSIYLNEAESNGSSIRIKFPQPSDRFIQSYIESYNKGNIITDVLVSYNNLVRDVFGNQHLQTENDGEEYLKTTKLISSTLKVDPVDNTISIHRIKNTYTEKEVESLIYLAWATASAYGDKTDEADCKDWIKHNLK